MFELVSFALFYYRCLFQFQFQYLSQLSVPLSPHWEFPDYIHTGSFNAMCLYVFHQSYFILYYYIFFYVYKKVK